MTMVIRFYAKLLVNCANHS